MKDLIDIEAQAREHWNATRALQYAFPDFTTFVQSRWAIHRINHADLIAYNDALVADHEASIKRAAERIALLRRPISSAVQSSIFDRYGGRLVIYIYGPLDEDRKFGQQIADAINANADAQTCVLRISSPGGETRSLRIISDALRKFRGRSIALIDHYALSAAGSIAMACDRVVMRKNAILMLHRAICTATGNYLQLYDRANRLRAEDEALERQLYAFKRQSTRDTIATVREQERYLSADEALTLGLADAIAPALEGTDELIASVIPQEERKP